MVQKYVKIVGNIERIAHVVLSTYMPSTYGRMKAVIGIFYKDITKRIINRGASDTIKFVKETRNAVMRYLTGEPLSSSTALPLDSSG